MVTPRFGRAAKSFPRKFYIIYFARVTDVDYAELDGLARRGAGR